jgi:chaperone required for assembly of F1-ATPase
MSPNDAPERLRRFYKTVEVAPVGAGWGVLLDARPALTPARARLSLPTQALAGLAADEWSAQGETIDMRRMPATRLAFTAIDRMVGKQAEVAAEVARYAGADLLCYFAEAPTSLVERQTLRWGPILDWAEHALGLIFNRAVGVIHRAQPPQTVAKVQALALALDDFNLAGLAMASALFGSAILGFALQRDQLDGEAAFDLSRLDEEFQEEKWGVDAEAADRRAHLASEARMLAGWFQSLR